MEFWAAVRLAAPVYGHRDYACTSCLYLEVACLRFVRTFALGHTQRAGLAIRRCQCFLRDVECSANAMVFVYLQLGPI